jgi:hypothetical protein
MATRSGSTTTLMGTSVIALFSPKGCSPNDVVLNDVTYGYTKPDPPFHDNSPSPLGLRFDDQVDDCRFRFGDRLFNPLVHDLTH